jgi:anaerobic ribonucleoside-triphosphate reductase
MPIRQGGITIEDSERRECEVWCRVMGYMRPVRDWNIGKRQEHRDRRFYKVPVETPIITADALQ